MNKCTKIVNHSKIVFKESGRKAVFSNERQLDHAITQVDGCLIENGMRCDVIISQKECGSVLVELKGKDVEHACLQLKATVDHKLVRPLLEKQIGFLVICSRFPRIDAYVMREKQRFAKHYRAGLHVFCNQREVTVEKLVSIDGK